MSLWSALTDLFSSAYKKVTGLIWHKEEEPGTYSIPHELYAHTDTAMANQYRSIFRAVNFTEEGEEETQGFFTITHDDILNEDDIEEAINQFSGTSGDWSYDDWEFVGGTTSLPESVEWEEE